MSPIVFPLKERTSVVLAIDTASDICSVALLSSAHSLMLCSESPKRHAAEVLPLIQQLLNQSELTLPQLSLLAIVSGPGSFTGLRIGTAVAQGLAYGAELPIAGISSLAILARAARHQTGAQRFIDVCLHAREDEFYFARYQDDCDEFPVSLIADRMCSSADILDLLNDHPATVLAGSGWLQQSLHPAHLKADHLLTALTVDAQTLGELALLALAQGNVHKQPELALPAYLKDDMAYRTVL